MRVGTPFSHWPTGRSLLFSRFSLFSSFCGVTQFLLLSNLLINNYNIAFFPSTTHTRERVEEEDKGRKVRGEAYTCTTTRPTRPACDRIEVLDEPSNHLRLVPHRLSANQLSGGSSVNQNRIRLWIWFRLRAYCEPRFNLTGGQRSSEICTGDINNRQMAFTFTNSGPRGEVNNSSRQDASNISSIWPSEKNNHFRLEPNQFTLNRVTSDWTMYFKLNQVTSDWTWS